MPNARTSLDVMTGEKARVLSSSKNIKRFLRCICLLRYGYGLGSDK